MALKPLEQARLSAQLLDLRAQMQAGTLNPIQQARTTVQALDLYTQLGGAAPDAQAIPDAEQAAQYEADDGLSDDPNSENYRYKDTGYISGSRKELATASIKQARDAGQMLRVSDIDFKAIEENPRQARELIKKSNLFGVVDWSGLKTDGMPPQVGYLVDRLYAAIAVMPSEDSPEARQSYALGIETIRTRLEQAKTVDDVTKTLTEIGEELLGTRLNAEESALYSSLLAQANAIKVQRVAIRAGRDVAYNASQAAFQAKEKAKYAYENRIKRGWSIDDSHDQALADAESAYQKANKAWGDEVADTKEEDARLSQEYGDIWHQLSAITDTAKLRNLNSPESKAWYSLGDRFVKATMYRKLKSSDTFAGHVANARAGQPPSWDWAERERVAPIKRASKKKITFTLKVVEQFERAGGRPVAVASTSDLERLCGFRAVQSGNWVLDDFASAKWHVEQSAGAMMDMADVLGIDESHLGFGGRLSMAFGARGTGGKGAAKAHYEPVERVINMTKMNGGGSLGHEVLHALDNILPSLLRGEEGAKDEFATNNPELMPAGAIRDAFAALKDALTTGDQRLSETIKLPAGAYANAQYNLSDKRRLPPFALNAKNAATVDEAIIAIDRAYENLTSKSYLKQKKLWRQIAAAYHSPEGTTEVTAKVGASVSNFLLEAHALDDGQAGKYWSETHEMAARAFQSYLEDHLANQGRKNDYLSCLADNRYHYFPDLDAPFKPYPEGAERTRINAAFDQVFKALRDEKAFETAMKQTDLLDSIFGVRHEYK